MNMGLRYRIDILAELKDRGYSSYRLLNDKIFGSGTIQKLRNGEVLNADGISKLCELLNMQPADLLIYVKE